MKRQWLTWEQRVSIFRRDHFICHYCDEDVWFAMYEPQIDHKVPISAGGTDDPTNLVTSCRSCNARKGSRPYEDFIKVAWGI